MKTILYISSFVVLLVTVLYFVDENVSAEWRTYQQHYLRMLGEFAADDSTNIEPPDVGLRQIYLPEMNRVDRCVTCHLAMEDPRFAGAPNPYKSHPGDYLETHDVEKVGCTICHDGQGRAIVWADALALEDDKFWEKPILKPPFLEANCYRCHTDTLAATPTYNRGKRIFESSGCLGCHQRDGKGGYLAPEYRGIGDASFGIKHPTDSLRTELLAEFNNNRNLAYIYESVRYPTAQPANSVMLDYGFSHDDAVAVTVYLKSLTGMQPGVIRLPASPPPHLTLLERGRKTFELYCRACHGEAGSGGVKNPNYVNDVIPELDLLSEKMFLFEREDADTVVAAVARFGDLNKATPPPDVPRFPLVMAQYNAILQVIANGNPAGKLDPNGPQPFNMPSWKKSLSFDEINSVIAYLITTYDFDDEE